MKESTVKKLGAQFSKFPFMKAGPVTSNELTEAEKKLAVRFDESYADFVQRYGGAIVGAFPVYGLRHSEPMDDEMWSVVDVTMRYRKDGWPIGEESYVISSDHADNPVFLREDSKVYSYDHDVGEMLLLADSFDEYLTQCLDS